MNKPEAIKKIFPNKNIKELSEIWSKVFVPELEMIHPVKLDEEITKEYGEYETSLQDFILENFGEDVLNAVKN